jgi:hypothetical protein
MNERALRRCWRRDRDRGGRDSLACRCCASWGTSGGPCSCCSDRGHVVRFRVLVRVGFRIGRHPTTARRTNFAIVWLGSGAGPFGSAPLAPSRSRRGRAGGVDIALRLCLELLREPALLAPQLFDLLLEIGQYIGQESELLGHGRSILLGKARLRRPVTQLVRGALPEVAGFGGGFGLGAGGGGGRGGARRSKSPLKLSAASTVTLARWGYWAKSLRMLAKAARAACSTASTRGAAGPVGAPLDDAAVSKEPSAAAPAPCCVGGSSTIGGTSAAAVAEAGRGAATMLRPPRLPWLERGGVSPASSSRSACLSSRLALSHCARGATCRGPAAPEAPEVLAGAWGPRSRWRGLESRRARPLPAVGPAVRAAFSACHRPLRPHLLHRR